MPLESALFSCQSQVNGTYDVLYSRSTSHSVHRCMIRSFATHCLLSVYTLHTVQCTYNSYSQREPVL